MNEQECLWQIVANFGATPFKSSVSAMRAKAARRVEQRILQTSLPCDRVSVEQCSHNLAHSV